MFLCSSDLCDIIMIIIKIIIELSCLVNCPSEISFVFVKKQKI